MTMTMTAPRSGRPRSIHCLRPWLFVLTTILLFGLTAGCTGGEKHVRHDVPRLYPVDSVQFRRTMGALLGPGIVGGNRIQTLVNGDRIFPSMLSAIGEAKETITFESFIYWSGEVGDRFATALVARAQAGVRVHVLIDWLGSSRISFELLERLREGGVEVELYKPLRWYNIHRINNRTHRKLLIVDGRIGFTGGVGIADDWAGDAQDEAHWRDTHYRVEGPVVAQMQAVFMDNWIKVRGRVLHGENYFPAIAALADGVPAQAFSASPSGGAESMRLMVLLAITASTKSIDLSSAYFVPDERTRDAMVAATERGVRIRIITPGKHNDSETVRRASRSRWGDLLTAGVEIYEYRPTVFHCKGLIIDGLFSSVGSTNFDPRSFGINDEANLNVYDAGFASEQIANFERDLKSSRQITLEEWRHRPLLEQVLEQAASLAGSQL